MSEEKTRKALYFDLDTAKLKEKGFKDTRPAYAKIKDFLLKNGFEHRQYSGYVSKEPLDRADIVILAKEMAKKLAWFQDCLQKFDSTEVVKEQYNLLEMMNKPSFKTRVKNERLIENFEKDLKNFSKIKGSLTGAEEITLNKLKTRYNKLTKEGIIEYKPLSKESEKLIEKIFDKNYLSQSKTKN